MFHINEDIKGVLTPKGWRNKVARFLNNLCGDGEIIEVHRPDDPKPSDPPSILLNIRKLIDKLTESNFGGYVQENTYDDTGSASVVLARAQEVAKGEPKPDEVNRTKNDDGTTKTALQIAIEKIRHIGTSKKLAREDHIHPLATLDDSGTPALRPSETDETDATSTMAATDVSGRTYQWYVDHNRVRGLHTDEWTPETLDDEGKPKALRFLVISASETDTDNGAHFLFFRELTLARNGNAWKLSGEKGAIPILA